MSPLVYKVCSMQRVHNETVYDTETAEQIVQTVLHHFCRETLYKTDEDEYFIHRGEWSPERYVIVYDEMEPAESSIRFQGETEALGWCQRHRIDADVIIDEFSLMEESNEN